MIGVKASAKIRDVTQGSATVPRQIKTSTTVSVRKSSAPVYDGEYEVVPGPEPVVLETDGYLLKDNVRVKGVDYPSLNGKPKINGVTLIGDQDSPTLHLQGKMDTLTVAEIEKILYVGG